MLYRPLLAAMAICALPGPAIAIIVDGSFSGVARASTPLDGQTRPAAPSAYDGARVSGTFRLNIPTEPWDDGSGVAPPYGEIRFNLLGETFAFLAGPDSVDSPGVVSISQAPLQSVTFQTNYRPRFDGAALTFGSFDGQLFDPSDFRSLRIDGSTVSWMDASFAVSAASLAVAVDVDEYRFGSVAAPVDEPPALALLGIGMAALGLVWRRRAATRTRACPTACAVPEPT